MCSQQAPKTKPTPLHLRVFLSSPGDVADERALARRLLKEELPYDPLLRDRVTFDVVSWDDPAAPAPMLATRTPQEAVNRGLAKPSDCNIAVVILWSRIGTPLPPEYRKPTGEPYLSGTEWEYEDACNSSSRPEIFVYRRTEKPKVELTDSDLWEKHRQYELVEQFFARFRNPDGSLRGGITEYVTPTEFKDRLANDLKYFLRGCLSSTGSAAEVAPGWIGSPYPGLRAFTSEEAAIFFGRGRETDVLIAQLRDPDQRFLAVVGASGTGKSSLVRAGLLPRLKDGAIEGSQHWCVLTLTPAEVSDNPFQALATKLSEVLPPGERKPAREIATALATAPREILKYAAMILAGRPAGAALVLVIDQFEELFTRVTSVHQVSFIDLLTHAINDPRLRVLTTVRADFLPRCMADPQLLALLQSPTSTYLLGPPRPGAFADIIRKPAERAGLELEEGLVEEILKDAGADPGALPLVAFCLETLYCPDVPRHRLTLAAYEDLGRLRGAIGRRTNALLADLRETEGTALDTALPQLFHALVHIGADGTATRRRAFRDDLGTQPPMSRLVEALVQGRLLLAENADGRATITLAHEALLTTWPNLCDWLDRNRTQLQRLYRALSSITASDSRDRLYGAKALGEIGPVAMEVMLALITALDDTDVEVRREAASALGQIGPAAAEAAPHLITALGDDDQWVRRKAASALQQIGPLPVETIPALITTLKNPDHWIRRSLTNILGQIGPAAAEAAPHLITALGDVDGRVRSNATSALRQIGPAATKAVPALMTALADPDQNVVKAAKSALKRIQSASPPTPSGSASCS